MKKTLALVMSVLTAVAVNAQTVEESDHVPVPDLSGAEEALLDELAAEREAAVERARSADAREESVWVEPNAEGDGVVVKVDLLSNPIEYVMEGTKNLATEPGSWFGRNWGKLATAGAAAYTFAGSGQADFQNLIDDIRGKDGDKKEDRKSSPSNGAFIDKSEGVDINFYNDTGKDFDTYVITDSSDVSISSGMED